MASAELKCMKNNSSITWTRASSIGLFFILTILILPVRARAQDATDPEVQQLEQKLQQLEASMEEVRAEINALKTKEALERQVASVRTDAPQPAQSTVGVQPVAALSLPKIPSASDSVATARVKSPTEAGASPQEPPAEPPQEPSEHEITPAPEGTIELYGFTMLDSGYNFGQIDPDWFDVMRPTKLPAFSNEFGPSGNVFFSVRQTRFGVKTTYPTSHGDLKTIFEFELFGVGVDAGQTTFRLRHAWGELGHFGAGQTWSPFMDPDVFPNSLEYWGPNGMVFFRNLQFRWTPYKKGESDFMIAAERPGATADGGVYAGHVELAGVTPQFTLPDLSVQGRWGGEAGHLQVAAIFRKLSWVDLNATPTSNIHGTILGWGVNTSANAKFDKHDTGRFQVVYGHGISNYMNDAPIDVGAKANPSNPTNPITGVALPVLGIVAFDDHKWGERFGSTIGYSYVNINNSPQELTSDFHQGHYALANLVYYPVESVMMGGEFQFGRRLNFSDGWNYNDYKLQFSFKYSYSKKVAYVFNTTK
jgi:DcaP outer membrane protein